MVYICLANPKLGVTRRIKFTEKPVACKTDLKEILGLAGHEARLADDGSKPLTRALLFALLTSRTYEAWKAAGRADRPHDYRGPTLSENIVQLVVSGPQQPDLSIVDLPGMALHSGVYADVRARDGRGRGHPRNLANTYLKKPESLILLCLPAGGRDLTTDTPEVQLVLNHDAELKRCMTDIPVIVTKPDFIGDPTESAWGYLIVGHNKSFPLSPVHGVHPVRCRTGVEYHRGISGQEVIARGDSLFSEKPWRELAAKARRKFGWVETSRRLSVEYKKLVKNNVPELRRRIQRSTARVIADQTELPPAVACPVDDLHTIIERIAEVLKEHLTIRGDVTQSFLDLQVAFERELLASVASFVPVLKADAPPIPEGDRGARAALTREIVARCGERCHKYNQAYWAAMNTLVGNLVAEECQGLEAAAGIVCDALRDLSVPLQDEITAFINGRIAAEQAPHEQVDTNDEVPRAETARVLEQYVELFNDAYPADQPRDLAGAQATHAHFPPPDTPPNQWNEKYWHLQESIKRLKGTVGRELPVYVITKFLPRVTTTLRGALHLNNVQEAIRKRAHTLCEPDDEVVANREAFKKRRTALEELQSVLDSCSV
ncbi:hypothetical protein CspeluHIS016_0402410 [Cutaneotrichosporon spelunceum]|uniref:GED domain-containing protein n=1 Tax=Cutaneotrichosporon spelunceum TaxID=1672016 RepID=A0AAD3TUZ1_9TREE|nr:hypothetical protein CspeluHIS016_0402410 [Cutaneotrichosporon spelunceum]